MRAVASFSRFDTEVAAASSMSGCRGRRSAGSGGERGGEGGGDKGRWREESVV